MRRLFYTLLMATFLVAPVQAQNFSLIGGTQSTATTSPVVDTISVIDTLPAMDIVPMIDTLPAMDIVPVMNTPAHQQTDTVVIGPVAGGRSVTITSTQITILLTDFAEIRSVEGGQKAVFLSQEGILSYNGVLIKVAGEINNPLIRIYKKPGIFPPGSMRKYSDTEWFYYGDPGEYIVEYLDFGANGWSSEFIEVSINGQTPHVPIPTDPNPTDPNPTDPIPQPPGDYAAIRVKTGELVKALNSPTVANSLIKHYTTALSQLDGSIESMRLLVRNSRRAAFQETPSTDARWNALLMTVDQMMIDNSVDTPEEYKKAITAYVNGIGDGIK